MVQENKSLLTIKVVKESFQHYHNLIKLAVSPLLNTPLCPASLLEPLPRNDHGYAIHVLLNWTLEQLKKSQRGHYEIVYAFYVEGKSQLACAGEFHLSVKGVQNRLKVGCEKIHELWSDEWEHQIGVGERKRMINNLRFDKLSAESRNLLTRLSVFETLEPRILLLEKLSANQYLELEDLTENRWLQHQPEGNLLQVTPAFREFLLLKLTSKQLLNAHIAAARFYQQSNNIYSAVYHFQQADHWDDACKLILDNKKNIGRSKSYSAWKPLLDTFFKLEKLSIDDLCRLHLVAGEIAEFSESIDAAEAHYLNALRATSAEIITEAHYSLGHLNQQKEHKKASYHYAQCKEVATQSNLFSWQIMGIIGIAWMQAQDNSFEAAKSTLEEAEQLFKNHSDNALYCQLQMTWAELYTRSKQPHQRLHHTLSAHDYAYKSNDHDKKIKTTHNLALAYSAINNQKAARIYAEKSLKEAEDADDKRMIGLITKTLATTYFREDNFEQSYTYLLKAYDTFQETRHSDYLAKCCFDLAEACLKLGRLAEARRYYEKSTELPKDNALGENWDKLINEYPELDISLNPRQIEVLPQIRQYGRFTRHHYCDWTNVSLNTATKDLNDLVAKRLITANRMGVTTLYIFLTLSF